MTGWVDQFHSCKRCWGEPGATRETVFQIGKRRQEIVETIEARD